MESVCSVRDPGRRSRSADAVSIEFVAKGRVSNISATDSTSGVLYGVGVGYTFTPNIPARLEAQKRSSDSSNVAASLSQPASAGFLWPALFCGSQPRL
jgi:hypothetical protein